MNVGIDAAGCQNPALSGEDLRGGSDLHSTSYAIHDAGISRLSDCGDPTITDCDISLVDSGVVENQRIGDNQIGRTSRTSRFRRLTHAVADDLTAAELYLVAVNGPVRFHFDDQSGISEANAVAGRGTVVACVSLP